MPKKKYSTSALAQLRVEAGLSQVEAAKKLGFKHKQTLCGFELGIRHVNPKTMKKMRELYGCSTYDVLAAAVRSFEHGSTMAKHRDRKARLEAMRQQRAS